MPSHTSEIHFLIGYLERISVTRDYRNAALDCYQIPYHMALWITEAIKERRPDLAAQVLECGVSIRFDENRATTRFREVPIDLRDAVVSHLIEFA